MSNTAETPRLTVLFAPANTLVDEAHFGSDYYWAYKLIQRLALDHGVQIIALVARAQVTQDVPGVRFITVDPTERIPVSNLDSLRFHLRCYAKAREILQHGEHVDVVHHMLPFGFRTTFNLLALGPLYRTPPILVGPLQPPYLQGQGAQWHVAKLGNDGGPQPRPAPPPSPRRFPPLSSFVTIPALSALSARTLRRASALVAVSEYSARRYASYTGISTFSIISPGVDTEVFFPARDFHSDGLLDNQRPTVILTCGRLTQRKAFDIAIQAVGKLIHAGLAVHVRLVGDGPEREKLEALTHDLGIAHAVTFVGSVPHHVTAQEYRQADIFCSTSRGEGFATVALEALASGLPIIATPAGGFREVLQHHRVGALVPFDAVANLASALTDLVTNPTLRVSLGQRARDVAVQEYDWRIIANRYMALYRRITSHGTNNPPV